MNDSSFVWQDKYERVKAYKHNFIGKPTGLNEVTEANAAASLNTTANVYDSLGEAYMVNGDKELAIKNYQYLARI